MPFFEAVQPIQYIKRPGTEFAEFTIADDVDARLFLLFDDVNDRFPETGLIGFLIDLDAVFNGMQIFYQLRRADKTANMRGQYSIHVFLPEIIYIWR